MEVGVLDGSALDFINNFISTAQYTSMGEKNVPRPE